MVEWNPFHLEKLFFLLHKKKVHPFLCDFHWFFVFCLAHRNIFHIELIVSFTFCVDYICRFRPFLYIHIQYFLCCLHIFDVGVFFSFYRYPSSLYTDCWFQHWMCIMHFTMETLVWWFTLWKLCKNVSGKNYKFHGALIFMHEKIPTINFANSGQWMTEAKMNEFMAKFQCALQWSFNARRLSFRMIYLVVILCS